MIETPSAGASQSPWWYRNRSAVFGILYGVGFWVPAAIGGFENIPYIPTIVPLSTWLGGDAAITALFCLGLFLVFLCFLIRLWGSSYLQSAIVWNADAKAEKLFVEGPFRYTRNPLYFGNMFMALGLALIAPPAGAAFIVVANAVLLNALIAHEEPLLRATFGEAYERYCASVPRFWPRLRPAPAEGDLEPNFAQGLLTETFTLALFLGMCCFFAPMPYGLYGFVAFYLFGIFSQRIFARRAA
jgi:protein-S-isoprenylcysteine O-methyltransferase Ste14